MGKNYNIFSFKSIEFNTTESKDYFINENNFGDDVILWLSKELSTNLNLNIGNPTQEDFGWCVSFGFEKSKYILVVGSRINEKREIEWLGWLERKRSIFEFLKQGNTNMNEKRILVLIDEILKSSKKANDIRWYAKEEFDKGREENYIKSPK